MIMNKVTGLLAMLVLSTPAALHALTIGGPDAGFTFELDDGYSHSKRNGFHQFRSTDGSRRVIIREWPGLQKADIDRYIEQGYQDERMALITDGEAVDIPVEGGVGKLVDIEGIVERRKVDGIAGGFIGDEGQGFVMLFLSSADDWPGFEGTVSEISKSIAFTSMAAGLQRSFDTGDWRRVLSGARLSLRTQENEYRVSEDYDFCSNGRFYHRLVREKSRHDDNIDSIGFSRKERSGRWRITERNGKSVLQMRNRMGDEVDFMIEDRDGKTYLDGVRYYLLQNRRCR